MNLFLFSEQVFFIVPSTDILPMLSGSLMLTIQALQVAVKDRIQNNAS